MLKLLASGGFAPGSHLGKTLRSPYELVHCACHVWPQPTNLGSATDLDCSNETNYLFQVRSYGGQV